MKRIPERWEIYKPLGTVIKGTRFLPFKVPLQQALSRHIPAGIAPFTPDDLVNLTKEQGNNLGLVIDLTNTKKYYKKEHIEKYNIKYEKIFTEGHIVPSSAVRGRFFEVVDTFLQSSNDEKILIGVHCTHGLNRTGYLICRYLIDRLKWNPEDCIKAFNEARGHDMERQNYLDDLRQSSYTTDNARTEESRRECRYDMGRNSITSNSQYYEEQLGQSCEWRVAPKREAHPQWDSYSTGYHGYTTRSPYCLRSYGRRFHPSTRPNNERDFNRNRRATNTLPPFGGYQYGSHHDRW